MGGWVACNPQAKLLTVVFELLPCADARACFFFFIPQTKIVQV